MNTTYHRIRQLVTGTSDPLRGAGGQRRGHVVAGLAAAAVLAVAAGVGWGLAADDGRADPADLPLLAGAGSSPASDLDRGASPGPSDDDGARAGGAGTGSGGGADGGSRTSGHDDPPPSAEPSPSPDPDPSPDPAPGGGPAELERVLLLPVDLVAPVGCFTEGLAERYVGGYGAQLVDTRPHGELLTTRVEHDELTRLELNSTERKVHVLPGSGRAAEAEAGTWTVAVDVHVFLSGGFKIDYSNTHQGETGQFRQTFTSSVDSTCTVELVYAITTSPVQ